MPAPLNIIVLGTAGSGKTTLAANFGRWVEETSGLPVSYVNLDPGAEFIPFRPDFDVRDLFTVGEIMRREGLGPNGAMMRVAELLAGRIGEISEKIGGLPDGFRIIDTPGQMEVFLFHGGAELVDSLGGATVAVFLMDARTAGGPIGVVLTRLLELSAGLKLGARTVGVLNKIDLVEDRDRLNRLISDPDFLRERIEREARGLEADLSLRLSRILPEFLPPARIIMVSAKTGEGFRELYDILHETLCTWGDLT
jgi:hypothetical protein